MKIKNLNYLGFVGVLAAFYSGCASTQGRFEKITPGMSTDQVKKAMDSGPSRFEKIEETNYSAWYWGEDYCVLFQNEKVVAKDSAKEGRTVSVGPGKYEEKHSAQCLAPGQTAEASSTDRTINIPGVGQVKLPKSKLRAPADNSEEKAK